MAEATRLPAGIAILGPTGCGKSALALQLADALPVELVSVDSAQVYRGLDIGTAKPTPTERAAVPHHLVDIREPWEGYSAGEFQSDALRLIREIAGRGRVPVLVGGTMLYYRALFRGLAELPSADALLREAIDARAAREGWPALHAELAAQDADAAARIHPHDAHRIQRALELHLLSGRARHELWQSQGPAPDFRHWQIGVLLPLDRVRLHAVLAQRLEVMLAAGFVDEVRRLLQMTNLSDDSHTWRLVGYRQMRLHAQGREALDMAANRVLAATRQLAKRQITWLRGNNLLPIGASVVHADPFDAASTQVFLRALIKGAETP